MLILNPQFVAYAAGIAGGAHADRCPPHNYCTLKGLKKQAAGFVIKHDTAGFIGLNVPTEE